MKSSFKLRDPNITAKESLILFSCYFKNEKRKFVYSTGENIFPSDWDFELKRPKHLNGRTSKADQCRRINTQLNRYPTLLNELISKMELNGERPTIKSIRARFDEHFKKSSKSTTSFFSIYALFLNEKRDPRNPDNVSKSTIKRYECNERLLKEFEAVQPYKLTLSGFNLTVWNDLINYCINKREHSANTLSRNLGLVKSFLNWAFLNRFTYNDEFKQLKKVKKFPTQEIALSLEIVKEIAEFDFEENERLERVRDLFVWGCATGMRFGNYSTVRKKDVYDGKIHVVDIKDNSKLLEIPLSDFAKSILDKYDYELPKISNQKFNVYVKEAFKEMGYDEEVKKSMKYGNKIKEEVLPLYKRISSHTARRTFITVMKNRGVPDKIIMSITGHKSLPVLNTYYKPNSKKKEEFIKSIWDA